MSPIPTHATPRNGGEQLNLFGSSVLTVPTTSIFGLSVILPQQRACAACGSVEAKNTPGEPEHEAPLTAWPDASIGVPTGVKWILAALRRHITPEQPATKPIEPPSGAPISANAKVNLLSPDF